MSDAANAVSAGPPPSADPRDPMPEGRFLYRRVLAYLISAVVLALIAYIVRSVHALGAAQPGEALDVFAGMFSGLLWFLWAVLTYYLVAPSAEQITKFFQVGAALRSGVVFGSAAQADSAQGSATATSVAGRGVAVPEVAPAGYEGPSMDDVPEPDARLPERPTW